MPSSSKHFNLLMAADTTVGAVAQWVFPGTMDVHVFYSWMAAILLPAIQGRKRILMMDNHPAHLDPSVFHLVESHGHLLLRRPATSPDFAWIESCFSYLKTRLREKADEITEDNLMDYIYMESNNITGALAAHCHYYVPGIQYTPYSYANI
ncbi:hypothetical protein Pelo_5593 [Pelomyxa schiedti]|nr:hypothetical protein Pelo_5593 [Pelomyxa schiedti]